MATVFDSPPLSDAVVQGLSWASLLLSAAGALGYSYKQKRVDPAGGMDQFMAKNTQHWIPLGMSYAVGALGVWVLLGFPEIGTTWGWWGVLGYTFSGSVPFFVVMYLGPKVRRSLGDAYSLSDWAKARYGRGAQMIVGLTSIFYMFIFMTAELSATASVLRMLGGVSSWASIVPLALITMLYTIVGGLNASILTDRVQGVAVIILLAVLGIVAGSKIDVKAEHWYNESQEYFDVWFAKGVSHFSSAGFDVAVTLIIAVLSAELLNMTTWQRVWAAKDDANLKKGLIFAQVLLVPLFLLMGVFGMLAEAQDRGRDTPLLTWEPYLKHLAFFDLLRPLDSSIVALTVVLAVCMAASSIDSLQNGIMAVLAKDFGEQFGEGTLTVGGVRTEKAQLASRLLLLAFNVAAIFLAQAAAVDGDLNLSWLNLFLLADVIAVAVVVPLFFGLFDGMITQRGFYAGVAAGFLALMGWGWREFGSWLAGLEMIGLMAFGGRVDPFSAGLFAPRTPIVLTIALLASGAATWTVSCIDVLAQAAATQLAAEKPVYGVKNTPGPTELGASHNAETPKKAGTAETLVEVKEAPKGRDGKSTETEPASAGPEEGVRA